MIPGISYDSKMDIVTKKIFIYPNVLDSSRQLVNQKQIRESAFISDPKNVKST